MTSVLKTGPIQTGWSKVHGTSSQATERRKDESEFISHHRSLLSRALSGERSPIKRETEQTGGENRFLTGARLLPRHCRLRERGSWLSMTKVG